MNAILLFIGQFMVSILVTSLTEKCRFSFMQKMRTNGTMFVASFAEMFLGNEKVFHSVLCAHLLVCTSQEIACADDNSAACEEYMKTFASIFAASMN